MAVLSPTLAFTVSELASIVAARPEPTEAPFETLSPPARAASLDLSLAVMETTSPLNRSAPSAPRTPTAMPAPTPTVEPCCLLPEASAVRSKVRPLRAETSSAPPLNRFSVAPFITRAWVSKPLTCAAIAPAMPETW